MNSQLNTAVAPASEVIALENTSNAKGNRIDFNAAAQNKLTLAEGLICDQLDGQNLDENPKLWIAFTVLRSVRIYSQSGNSVPGYMGQGLTEALTLADSIIADPPKSDRDLVINSYKFMAAGISLANHG